MNPLRIAAGALVLALTVGACAGGDRSSDEQVSSTTDAPAVVASNDAASTADAAPGRFTRAPGDSAAPDPALELSPLAELVRPAENLRPATEVVSTAPRPVSVSIESIGVTAAGVRDVGVEANGEMEIPGAREVGWYRWSARPGSDGSAVLAAHIAYNGTDGVFRHLDDADVGDLVDIGFDDGSVREFEIVELSQYPKDELPFDRIFAKDGEPVVALITCGGTFNGQLRSYDDNVVAYAVPI